MKGSGKVYVKAEKSRGKWIFYEVQLEVKKPFEQNISIISNRTD